VFGKCYYNHDGARTFDIMSKLRDIARQGVTPLRFPAPLFYDADRKLLWQAGLSGQTLRDAGISNQSGPELLPLAAKAIARFHRIPADTSLPTTEITDVLATLDSRLAVLSQLDILDQQKLVRVAKLLHSSAKGLRQYPAVTLHGDVHSQNLFLQDNTIAFIDLDNVVMGSSLLDLASWIGGMIYWATMQDMPVKQLLPQLRTFINQYNRHVPWQINSSDLSWYIAAMLVNERIFRCVTRLKSGRLRIINELLTIAEQFALHRHRFIS
jgi:aminoglycoside phosphotransferase (APT) family kinase protein